jgi:HK97 family phage portal protein
MIPVNNMARMVVREMNGTIVPYTDNKDTYVEMGYNYNDIVYMCIKLIVDKAVIAPWATYQVVDEAAYKKAKEFRKQLDKPGMLVKYNEEIAKALKPYTADDALNKLLEAPNEENSLSKHHAMLWTYKLATGDYYERWGLAGGGTNSGKPNEWEVLPSQFMNIKTNRAIPLKVTGYQLTCGVIQNYEKTEVLHECYPNLSWSIDGAHFYGMAPLKPLSKRVQRNNESQTQGATQMKNGGQRSIVSLNMPDSVSKDDLHGTLTAEQTSELKQKFSEMVVNPATVGSSIFSGYPVTNTPVGLSPVDLDQVNLEVEDTRKIAAAFAVPSQLLNDAANKTYANESEGQKALILRCCLPLLNDREQSLNRKLKTLDPYKDGNIVISYDLSQYAELEANKVDQATYLNTAWWLTPNEKRVIMGETKLDDANMDKIYVSSSLQPLEDANTPPVEPITGDIAALNDQNVKDY